MLKLKEARDRLIDLCVTPHWVGTAQNPTKIFPFQASFGGAKYRLTYRLLPYQFDTQPRHFNHHHGRLSQHPDTKVH
jgi:hypothetical protein